MNLNPQNSPAQIEPPLMTEIVSLRLTQDERVALERLASREERTVSNYLRKQLRTVLAMKEGVAHR